MGDNIGKVVYRTLPNNADSLTTLYHQVDLKHSVISREQGTSTHNDIQTQPHQHKALIYFVVHNPKRRW